MKPLEGIKVVELSTMLAGPMTARLLAEWGADVIKVESMNGDPWRKQYGTSLSPYTEHANPNFDMQNINKRFVAFNMRTPEGKEAMMKLLATADVFLTNYRVQALEQMGLTYDQLGRHLQRERKLAPARQCFALARQYKENAAQLERARREAVGRLCCRLAERAERVERIFCGLPMVLKGEGPWN